MKFSKNSFKERLQKKGYAKSTIESYVRSLEQYEQWCRLKQNSKYTKDNNVAYRYLKHIKKQSKNPSTINGAIQPIKLYYRMFRKSNPFEYIQFQTSRVLFKDDSFSKEELEDIYNEYPQQTITQIRDKVLLGLYVFQGIKSSEVKTIETKDVDLSKYNILLKGDNRTNSRKIGLDVKQIILLSEYLSIHRIALQKEAITDTLIITSKGKNSTQSIIESLTDKLKKSTYGFLNFRQIRASVIRQWVKEYDLRKAQYLSGHRYISSTEKYITEDISELQSEVSRYFPLD